MPFENSSWSGRCEKVYIRSRTSLDSVCSLYLCLSKRLGATARTTPTVASAISNNTNDGAIAVKADFHAEMCSDRLIGQSTSSCDINGQLVIPLPISIPADM